MNLVDPIHDYAKSTPDRPAIITPQRTMTWRQLDNVIWSTALGLSRSGLASGDRVGISMANPVIHLVTALALARIGAAHITIPTSEAPSARDALSRTLELKALVSDLEQISSTTPGALLITGLSLIEVDADQKRALASTNGDLPWLILQSSGTTGSPKFAELSHDDTIQRCAQFPDTPKVEPGDVAWVPPRQDLFICKYTAIKNLRSGASICMPIGMPVSNELVDFLNANGVTIGAGIPSTLVQLIEVAKPIPSLRFFGVTSAPVPDALRDQFRKTVNPNLYVIYAANETGSITMAAPTEASRDNGSVGRPAANIDVEIVGDDGTVRPDGQPGEIRVRVPGAVKSYLGNAQATEACFRGGWFYPGDLGLIDSAGELVFLGRKDDMMIFDGLNIFPAEIEAVLNAHPAIAESAAFPLKSHRFHEMPAAAVRLQEPVSGAEIFQFCRQKLGMKHPRKVFVVEDFPRNQMGKILKRELSRILLETEPS